MDQSTFTRQHSSGYADRAWAGHHPRAMLPAALALAALTAAAWAGRWAHPDLSALAARAGALTAFALMWAAWLALGAVFLYRTITYTYRLTDRAVLIDFGPIARPVPAVPLADVTAVGFGAGPLGRLFGVGWVEVRTAARTVRLTGVRHPEAFARLVRTAAGLAE